jgi:hypothetical protein
LLTEFKICGKNLPNLQTRAVEVYFEYSLDEDKSISQRVLTSQVILSILSFYFHLWHFLLSFSYSGLCWISIYAMVWNLTAYAWN